jgi:hypothetical protein
VTIVHGHCEPGFERVRDALSDIFAFGSEVGAALAVYVDKHAVVDLWAGHTDAAQTRPWERDTIVNLYSVGKAVTAVCALRLVEGGVLDLDAPVARYWPEFAQAGKARIRVRYLLTHQTALPAVTRALGGQGLGRTVSPARSRRGRLITGSRPSVAPPAGPFGRGARRRGRGRGRECALCLLSPVRGQDSASAGAAGWRRRRRFLKRHLEQDSISTESLKTTSTGLRRAAQLSAIRATLMLARARTRCPSCVLPGHASFLAVAEGDGGFFRPTRAAPPYATRCRRRPRMRASN